MKTARKNIACFFIFVFLFAVAGEAYSQRSITQIFPNMTRDVRRLIFTVHGVKNSFKKDGTPLITPAPGSGINLYDIVKEKDPSHYAEAMIVIPHNPSRKLNKLDAYNALSRIEKIKNHYYYNWKRDANINIFEESSRLDNDKKKDFIPDPPPAKFIPEKESIYLCLKDRYFGNLHVRGDLTSGRHGITYNITNFRAIRFLVFTIMKEEKFSAVLYLEPINEGMLIYGMAAVDIPNIVANRVNVSTDIERRLTIFINWLTEGLSGNI